MWQLGLVSKIQKGVKFEFDSLKLGFHCSKHYRNTVAAIVAQEISQR
jgi:hypothetical protein